jgi:DNA-binding beta-propeller fold protein YncE
LAVGENAVWIVGTNGEVARIDPTTNRVVKLIGTENGTTQVAAGLDAVWVLNPRLGTVTRIDPATNAMVATIDVGKGATAIAAGRDSIWVTRCSRCPRSCTVGTGTPACSSCRELTLMRPPVPEIMRASY